MYIVLVYVFVCMCACLCRDWHARALFIVPFLSRVLSWVLVLRLSFSLLSCARSRILSCVSVERQAVCILSLAIACVYRLPDMKGIQHLLICEVANALVTKPFADDAAAVAAAACSAAACGSACRCV